MSEYLGLDTSNYTTSAAVLDSCTGDVRQEKIMLPVKQGSKGLRQSEALFHHTKQLPDIIGRLFGGCDSKVSAVGVSSRPRMGEDSYMPCFLAGKLAAYAFAAGRDVPVYETSHQTGHILAALYCTNQLELVNERFAAFHISGGTTDILMCCPSDNIIDIVRVGGSNDLNAGQAIDRTGVMLGMSFPCGRELSSLAEKSSETFKIKPSVKGLECSFSGLENKTSKMLSNGFDSYDIARFCIDYIYHTIRELTLTVRREFGQIPLIFAGGVMSNNFIRKKISDEFGAFFAKPEFSCDNAVGAAVYACLKNDGRI